MKFILEENKKFILNEDTLTEAPKPTLNISAAPVSINEIDTNIDILRKMIENIKSDSIKKMIVLGIVFDEVAQEKLKNEIDAITKLDSILTNKPFNNLEGYSDSVVSTAGKALKELVIQLKNDTNLKDAISKFEKSITEIVAKEPQSSANDDSIETSNNKILMTHDSTQKDWENAFKKSAGNTAMYNNLWDQWYSLKFGSNKKQAETLGSAVEIEARELGYTATTNPFINFINSLFKNKYPVTRFSYGAIHNNYDTIKKENLNIENDLFRLKNIYELDGEFLSDIIEDYFSKNDDDSKKKVIWALVDGGEKVNEKDINTFNTNTITNDAEICTRVEYENNRKKVNISKVEKQTFNAGNSAKNIAGIAELKKIINYIINTFGPADVAKINELKKKYNIIDASGKIDAAAVYNANNIDEVITLKKAVNNAIIKEAQLDQSIKSLISASNINYPINEKGA